MTEVAIMTVIVLIGLQTVVVLDFVEKLPSMEMVANLPFGRRPEQTQITDLEDIILMGMEDTTDVERSTFDTNIIIGDLWKLDYNIHCTSIRICN